jgi:hypothetical protein
MVESKEEVFVKEERWPEATPAVIPPSIFLWQLVVVLVLCFSYFYAASSWEHQGGL